MNIYKVKWWNDSKGYGFIHPESDPSQAIFAHYTAIHGDGFKTLTEGERVSADIIDGPKGPQATNIVRLRYAAQVSEWLSGADQTQEDAQQEAHKFAEAHL